MEKNKFDELVRRSYESLPAEFLKACDGVLVRSEDFADEDVLASLGIDNPYHLLGLYHGVNLTRKSVFDLPGPPDTVMIYRKPIVAFAKAQHLPLEEVVLHVVVHEIGHHMGFSDDDMEAIEFGRDGFYHKSSQ